MEGVVAGKWVGELKSESEGSAEILKNTGRRFRRNYERWADAITKKTRIWKLRNHFLSLWLSISRSLYLPPYLSIYLSVFSKHMDML